MKSYVSFFPKYGVFADFIKRIIQNDIEKNRTLYEINCSQSLFHDSFISTIYLFS